MRGSSWLVNCTEANMRRPQITKLFAVVALLGSAAANAETSTPRTLKSGRPACGNVMGKDGKPTEDCVPAPRPVAGKTATGKPIGKPGPKPATVATPAPGKPTPAPATPLVKPTAPAMLTTSHPRQLGNGRPACGNVATRAARQTDCTPKRTP
jgi:hypothetical protein